MKAKMKWLKEWLFNCILAAMLLVMMAGSVVLFVMLLTAFSGGNYIAAALEFIGLVLLIGSGVFALSPPEA